MAFSRESAVPPLSVLVLYPSATETADFSPPYLHLAALVRHLAERQVKVHVIAPEARGPAALADLSLEFFPPSPLFGNLESVCAELAGQEAYRGCTFEEIALLLRFQAYREYPHPHFLPLLEQAVARVDAVLLDQPFWATFIAPLCRKHGKPLLLTIHHALHAGAQGKARKMLLVKELEAMRLASQVIFARAEDQAAFAALGIVGEHAPNPFDAGTLLSVSTPPLLPDAFGAYDDALRRLARPADLSPVRRRLVYIDQHLCFTHGHYANFGRLVHAAAKKAEVPFRALGHVNIDPSLRQETDCRPVFQVTWHSPMVLHPERDTPAAGQALHQYTQSNIRFHNDLRQAVPEEIASTDLLFFASAEDHQIQGACWLIESWPALFGPESVLMFLRYVGTQCLGPHSISVMKEAARNHRVRIGCDCREVADRFRAALPIPVEVLPIPLHIPAAPERPSGLIPPRREGVVRFVTLGDPRPEKGIHIVVQALPRFATLPEFARTEFVLHSLANDNPAIQSIQRMGLPNVHIVFCPGLTAAQYAELLYSADVILLPYDRRAYNERTSGVFVEALTCGKPVIVSGGTWMAGEIDGSGAGLILSDATPETLAQAFAEAVRALPALREKAELFQRGYSRFHNPDNLVRLLMRTPAPPLEEPPAR